MDKGFYSPAKQEVLKPRLGGCLDLLIKRKLSQADKARESYPEFANLRKQHSAVESAINALEIHGLDKCPDQSLHGFKRYIAMAVVARNIQRLVAVLRQQEKEATQRKRRTYKKQPEKSMLIRSEKSMAELCTASTADENHCHLWGKKQKMLPKRKSFALTVNEPERFFQKFGVFCQALSNQQPATQPADQFHRTGFHFFQ
jgi:hypothetical protein